MSSGVTRWLYWWDAVEKAVPSDFPRLARIAEGDSAAMRLVAERWVELAPREFFNTLVSTSKTGNKFTSEWGAILLEEWTKRDSNALVAALNESEDFSKRKQWRQQVAKSFLDKEPERGLQLMSDWRLSDVQFSNADGIRSWAAANPQRAAEFALTNLTGYASQQTIKAVAQEWAKSSPAQAMEFAVAHGTGSGSAMGETVLRSWTERNLKEAGDWLAKADPSTLEKFNPIVVEAWAKQDPASALSWCESNLSGSSLSRAVSGVFQGAVQKDGAAAADLVLAMTPSPARAEAAEVVAGNLFPFNSDKPISSETLSWLKGLDANSTRKVLSKVAWQWAETDSTSMAAYLQSASDDQVPAYIDSILAQTMARNNPQKTLDWTSQLPGGRGIVAGSDAISAWGRTQPDLAKNWLSELPQSDPRRQPFFSRLVQEYALDPQAIDQFTQLAATDLKAARDTISSISIPEELRSKLLESLKLP
jgi:hypothetical protein